MGEMGEIREVKEFKIPLTISLLRNKKGKTVGFKALVAKTKNIVVTTFCDQFAAGYRRSGVVVRLSGDTLVFDDSLGSGRRWLAPITIPQMRELLSIFKNGAAYVHEGYIAQSAHTEHSLGFRFVSPSYVADCLNELIEE